MSTKIYAVFSIVLMLILLIVLSPYSNYPNVTTPTIKKSEIVLQSNPVVASGSMPINSNVAVETAIPIPPPLSKWRTALDNGIPIEIEPYQFISSDIALDTHLIIVRDNILSIVVSAKESTVVRKDGSEEGTVLMPTQFELNGIQSKSIRLLSNVDGVTLSLATFEIFDNREELLTLRTSEMQKLNSDMTQREIIKGQWEIAVLRDQKIGEPELGARMLFTMKPFGTLTYEDGTKVMAGGNSNVPSGLFGSSNDMLGAAYFVVSITGTREETVYVRLESVDEFQLFSLDDYTKALDEILVPPTPFPSPISTITEGVTPEFPPSSNTPILTDNLTETLKLLQEDFQKEKERLHSTPQPTTSP